MTVITQPQTRPFPEISVSGLPKPKVPAFGQRTLTWYAITIFLFLYLPILILVIYSFNANKVIGVWQGFSLHWYQELFRDAALASALKVSLWIAFWSTILSVAIGTITAIAMERYNFAGKLPLDAILYLPIIIPDIVMALSLLLFFVLVAVPLSRETVLIAHVAFNISYVVVVIRARLAGMNKQLEEAAADLGADEWTTFRRITFPLLMPGVISAALMAFTMSLDDFVITFFVSGPGSTTLPVRVYSMIKFGVTPEINAISSLMLLSSTLLVVISLLLQRKQL